MKNITLALERMGKCEVFWRRAVFGGFIFLPETKGCSLKEIELRLGTTVPPPVALPQ
ncbi:hypothetical protein [Acetobacter estunensis]|uniref:hypothetical protein n=1 Tax=Acetobacter estunensis TaxID=104097 RepID=UPI001C2D236F|nr:hypothetical protein [Acetobacter estunensis]MBV1836946.1 hypothetical protein [Acetobacter estunensis]